MAKKEEGIPVPALDMSPPTEQIPAAAEPPQPEPATTEEPTPRKRRRRTKAELEAARKATLPAPAVVGPTTDDLERCRVGFAMIFGLVSKGLGKKWGDDMALTDEEVATLAGCWTDAIAPYLPKMGASMPIGTALVATLLIALPRYDLYQQRRAEALPA